MAYYAALLSVIELLEDILHPHRFPNSFVGSTHTFKSLHKKFSRLLSSLQDYSSTGRDADPREARVRDASFQALDLIEAQIPEHQQLASKKKLSMLIKKHLEMLVLKRGLKKAGREVDSIVQEIIAIKQSQMREHVAAASEQQQSVQIDVGNTVVGFEEQLLAIKEKLCSSSPKLEVIPIVGMGGIGKTTLATHTFHDHLIVSKFDFRGWVTISQDYNVVRVLHETLNSLGIIIPLPGESSDEVLEEREREKERAMKDGIHKYLKVRKFLIVIDDIWDTQVWDDIKHTFPDDCNGSRVLLTTRLEDVAEYVGRNNSIHHMQFLNEDASWKLFQEKTSLEECCPPELVSIGKCITSKCKGLPLAIVVIGGILSNEKTLRYWKNVADDVGSALNKDDKHLANILSLSYNHLPHHLKPCFLHVGSFPEDYEINISKLIRLWIAEGFLKTIDESKNLEDIGDAYIKDLVKRSLVIISKKKANGEIKSCIMHDLLRDFCRQRAHDEHFFHVLDRRGCLETNGMEKVRRIILESGFNGRFEPNDDGKYVRSICQFRKLPFIGDDDDSTWDAGSLLRILDSEDLCNQVIPYLASSVFHLKHLALNPHYDTHCIDPSISMFQNLETLIIYPRYMQALSLPSEIWKMRWLRYLLVDTMELPLIPPHIPPQKLDYLHTLQTVEDFIFTSEVAQIIPNVKKLKIMYRGRNVQEGIWKKYGLNNLVNMLQLEKLNMSIHPFAISRDDLAWSWLVFPHNLKKLSLRCGGLPWEAMRLVGCLKCLQVLKLKDSAFTGAVWEPVEGEFLELKFLLLEWLRLEDWRAEKTHFPKLQHLKIKACRDLKEIPGDIGDIETLEFITVFDSEKAGVSANKILEQQQQEFGNYGLQVIVR